MKTTFYCASLIIGLAVSPLATAEDFKIEFEWDPNMKSCFSKNSPEIKVFNVPVDTKTLSVKMKDRQSNYNHGGGKFTYNGESSIPAGALQSWEGPCPPAGKTHTYYFTVVAKGGKKAKAKYSQKFRQ